MRAIIGKSLSYDLYQFGIIEAEGMKAIKGLEYQKYQGGGAEQAKSLAAVGLRYLL
jgi:hypothetical protein